MNEEVLSMNDLMKEIREVTKKQKSASKIDEIRVMKSMLNDREYSISIYDKNKGYIGTRCPHDEAVKFIINVCSSVTGIDTKSAAALASDYEFTKKDAIFLLDNAKDFTQTYLSTGRKYPIVQSEDIEASIFTRPIEEKSKVIPMADGSKQTKVTAPFTKIICKSKNPKYHC